MKRLSRYYPRVRRWLREGADLHVIAGRIGAPYKSLHRAVHRDLADEWAAFRAARLKRNDRVRRARWRKRARGRLLAERLARGDIMWADLPPRDQEAVAAYTTDPAPAHPRPGQQGRPDQGSS